MSSGPARRISCNRAFLPRVLEQRAGGQVLAEPLQQRIRRRPLDVVDNMWRCSPPWGTIRSPFCTRCMSSGRPRVLAKRKGRWFAVTAAPFSISLNRLRDFAAFSANMHGKLAWAFLGCCIRRAVGAFPAGPASLARASHRAVINELQHQLESCAHARLVIDLAKSILDGLFIHAGSFSQLSVGEPLAQPCSRLPFGGSETFPEECAGLSHL